MLTWQHRLVAKKKKKRILRVTTCTLIHKVLSESVSKALASFGGTETKETALFTEMFGKFFDALNVRNFTDGKTQRKPFQDPYRSGKDFRLQVTIIASN